MAKELVIVDAARSILVMGLCLFIVGAIMMRTGDPGLIHGFHLSFIPSKQWPHLARWIGGGIAIASMGLLVLAVLLMMGDLTACTMVVVQGIIWVGAGICLAAVVYHTFRRI